MTDNVKRPDLAAAARWVRKTVADKENFQRRLLMLVCGAVVFMASQQGVRVRGPVCVPTRLFAYSGGRRLEYSDRERFTAVKFRQNVCSQPQGKSHREGKCGQFDPRSGA